jgi:predicted Mrr-cat superfamily restriction endonuclease
MNYWVNRISHGFPISGALFRYGYLTVGWSESVGLLEAANESRKQFREQFNSIFPDLANEDSLWRFLKEYEIGDIIVVPFPDERNNKFSIVKIQSEVERSKVDDIIDVGFVRKIEHLKLDIPRKVLTESAGKNLFATPKTTYCANEYKGAIQELLKK